MNYKVTCVYSATRAACSTSVYKSTGSCLRHVYFWKHAHQAVFTPHCTLTQNYKSAFRTVSFTKIEKVDAKYYKIQM